MAAPLGGPSRQPRGLNARLVMVGVALALAWVGVGYRLVVVQGVRHASDLIWRDTYARWAQARDTSSMRSRTGYSMPPWSSSRITMS